MSFAFSDKNTNYRVKVNVVHTANAVHTMYTTQIQSFQEQKGMCDECKKEIIDNDYKYSLWGPVNNRTEIALCSLNCLKNFVEKLEEN